jgi:Sigma-70 region 2
VSACPSAHAFPIAIAQRRAAFEVRQARRSGCRDDRDLLQDLVTTAVEKWPRYLPTRGAASTFLATVMRRRRISLDREDLAAKRGFGFRRQEWAQIPPDRLSFTASARMALRMDVWILVAALPSDLKRLCLTLMQVGVSEAARVLGISRAAAMYQIGLIRERFIEAGLSPDRVHA